MEKEKKKLSWWRRRRLGIKRKRMKTGKKAFAFYIALCMLLLIYVLVMLWRDQDSSTLSILAGAALAALTAIYKVYTDSSDKEKAIHMEKNYRPDYDEEEGLF